jgi:hypothetical protein
MLRVAIMLSILPGICDFKVFDTNVLAEAPLEHYLWQYTSGSQCLDPVQFASSSQLELTYQ